MKRIAAILLAVVLILTTGCGKSDSGKLSLKIGNQPYTQGIPIFIAEKEGWYSDVGLDVKSLTFVTGNTQNDALGANEWEVGVTGLPPSIFGGVSYGLKIIGFSVDDTVSPTFYARADSDIAQVKGEVAGCPDIFGNTDLWRGKKILCTTATSSHLMLVVTLQKLGLTEADVDIIHMDVSQAMTAFKSGQGDILATWPPVSFQADPSWVKVSSGVATGEQIPIVVVASEKALKENRAAVKLWMKTYYQNCEGLVADSDRLAEQLMELQLDNGLTVDLEGAHKIVSDRPLPSLAKQIELFDGEPGKTKADEIIYRFVDIFVEQGRISAQDKQKLVDGGFIDNSILMELKAEQK